MTSGPVPDGKMLAEAGPRWFAAYTIVRHEKAVARQLGDRGIETFLPLYRKWHNWKDRRKLVELALFPGYVFVKIAAQNKLGVLQTSSVVRIVTCNGQLAALPDPEIDGLRNALDNHVYAEPCPYLHVGRRVRVIGGPMVGAEGILTRKKDKYRVVVSVELLMRSVSVEVDAGDLDLLASSRPSRATAVR
jgi:transcription antitermination factor NusG